MDSELISATKTQIEKGLRNVNQGDMGRALAVSKLQTVKLSID